MKKRILLVGGGYAGVLTAKKLAKLFKKSSEVEITLVDKQSFHTMLTELHEVACDRVNEESIRLNLKDIFANRNVDVVLDEILEFDFKNQKAVSKNRVYEYDYLILGTGCKPTYWGIEGSENVFDLWTHQNAVDLKEHILNCFRKASCESNPEKRQQLLTFVTVGGGFTGVEMAGELGEWKDELCAQFHIDKSEVKQYLVDVLPTILPIYPESLIKKAERRLQKLGVTILNNHGVKAVSPSQIIFNNESQLNTSTVVWAAGIEGSDVLGKAELSKQMRNRVTTNGYLQSVDYNNVYVVGDNIFYVPEGEKAPVPQMVENAERCAPVVAYNIKADITGTKNYKTYKPKFNGSMVCIGSRYGVAHVGPENMRFKLSGFMAMLSKHFINLVYFIQVLGLHKIWTYLNFEFFQVRNRRSFVGGHFSNSGSAPGILLFPLRMFLGGMWLLSGVTKLPKVFEDWTNVFLFPPNPLDAATGATAAGAAEGAASVADATTAATGAAEGAATVAGQVAETSKSFIDQLAGIVDGKDAVPVPHFIQNIMEWANQHFFWAEAGGFTTFAAVVQTTMIFGEIAVGGMLLLGLLTPIAGLLSFVMAMMIYCSGWSYISIFFFGLGGLACMFSGNVLGLDYYLIPWLNNKVLKKWKFTRKWYLYF